MRFQLFTAVLITLLSPIVSVRADDSLFSQVAMESVFEKNIETVKQVAVIDKDQRIGRITSTALLVRTLTAAGFDAKAVDNKAKFQLKHAGWLFPVSMTVNVDQDRIGCEMSLAKVDENQPLDKETLLQLLTAGDAASGAFFAYEPESKRIQLRWSFDNRGLTATDLKTAVLKRANFADQNAKLWSPTKQERDAASSPKTNSSQENTWFSLVGSWSASLPGGEAFAIQISSDARFQLVHLKSGKSTVSKGKASRSGNNLTLAGDDKTTLNCQVSNSSADKFRLSVIDAKGNAAVNLDFKKAK
ncbi:type III secretion system chaperone [Novipirellula artificiosorum]|uniref:Uncharacterized protein n=1 Tax=Novipirellula artificiosorum TaxID=2528016 RepID=A0A5C6DS48_9BACT|nr:type III secretion system chaperone [Novipirellula artificiosorum]TWU38321.1 hypothetical protein Poly41_27970 [Novipirellula artificiosorum]